VLAAGNDAPVVRWPARAVIVLLVLIPLAGIVVDSTRIDHDVAMYVQSGQLLLDGDVPYVDFVDLNPPMIMYASVVPALLARWTHISPELTMLVLVWALVVASILTCALVLRRATTPQEHGSAVLVAIALTSAIVAARGVWGQREHLAFLAMAPFVLLRATDARLRRGARVAIGMAVGVVVCFKPWFGLVVALPELALLRRSGSARRLLAAEIIAAASVVAAFVGHWLVVPGDMRRAFFERWVPLVRAGYDRALGSSLPDLVTQGVRDLSHIGWWIKSPSWLALTLVLLGHLFVQTARGRRPAASSLYTPAALAAVGGLAVLLLQRKGWWYHTIPMLGFSLMAIGSTVRGDDGRRRTIAAWALVALAAVGVTRDAVRPTPADAHENALERLIDEHSHRDDRVLVLTPWVSPTYPTLLRTGRRPGSRYLWLIPLTLAESERDRAAFVADLEHDIRDRHPALIVVDDVTCGACGGVTARESLRRFGFDDATLDGYVEVDRVDSWVALTPAVSR
jgi:hypothetical protein